MHVKILSAVLALLALMELGAAVLVGLLGVGMGMVTAIVGGDGSGIAGAFFAGIGTSVAAFIALHGLFSGITAFGLLARKGWARILGVAWSGLNVLSFSWWSLVGLYGLWALLSKEGDGYFRRLPGS